MKRITDKEVKELSFGSMIRIIWHNSYCYKPNTEYYGVVFENKVGYENGKIGNLSTIAECICNDECMVYLM